MALGISRTLIEGDLAVVLKANSLDEEQARKVAQAMRDAGGMMLAFERLPHDVVQEAREWALEQAKA